MGYEISWYIPGRVVQATFTGTITPEEAEAASDQVAQFIQDGEGPLVHLIADTNGMERFPTNLNLLNRSASKHLWQPKLGWTIVISTNSTTRWISGIITQVARVRFRMFPTFNDGVLFLADQDPTVRQNLPTRSKVGVGP
ncbi:MAG: hypothetical protein K8I30_18790 [Anaerolineae bacterium]|nr:hypothetical protein [Anaerolineae bacterium]